MVKEVPQRIEVVFHRSMSGNEPVRERQKEDKNA